jgi:hypothetical protein
VANRLGGGPSLEAQPTFIDGESLVTFDLDAIAVAGDVHAALKRAVRTMRRDSGRDWIHPCPLPQQGACPGTSCRNGPACLRVPISKCSRMSLENEVVDKYERKHARTRIDEAPPAARRKRSSKDKSTQSLPAKPLMNHFRLTPLCAFDLCPWVFAAFQRKTPCGTRVAQ